MTWRNGSRGWLMAAAVLAAAPAWAQEIPPKAIVDVTKPDAPAKFTPTSEQVKVTPTDSPAGVLVTIEPGADAFPGLKVKPIGVPAWDMSSYGHVEMKLTNTGDQKLNLNLRVDNAGDSSLRPWNTENIKLDPGKSGTLTVIFGYAFGRQPNYPLKPEAISALQIFAGKSDQPQSFRIEQLLMAGPAGEKPPQRADNTLVKPKNGVIFGVGTPFDAAKQVEAKGGVTASGDEKGLLLTFPADPKASARLKPINARWDLRAGSQVRLKVKNEGTEPLTPTAWVSSEEYATTDKITAAVLSPGAEADIVVPFIASKMWIGLHSTDKPGHVENEPGTGTKYASGKTDSIYLAAGEKAGKLKVMSITLEAPTATLPDWVGKRPPVPGDWVVTFEDDFDGTSVDLSKWNNEGPNHWDKTSHWSKQNVIVENGVAKIRYEKKTGNHNDDPKLPSSDYAGGYLDTMGKFRQRYGYFESRMKMPTAPGLWPAFWTMPDRGPNAGDKPGSKVKRCTTSNGGMEFDIFEHLTVWGPYRTNLAFHWDDYAPATHKHTGGKFFYQTDKDGFVTAGLLWLPGQAAIYLNGQEVMHWDDPRVSKVPAYLMYTMPVGGWDNNHLDGTGLPDVLQIDYTRCWQRKDLLNNEADFDPMAKQ